MSDPRESSLSEAASRGHVQVSTHNKSGPLSLLDRDMLRHSARTAAAAIASLLAARLSRLPEGYWAAITTLGVMQSVLGTSLPIAGRQFTGNALGAGLGAALVAYVRPSVWTFGAGILLLGLIYAALGHADRRLRDHLDTSAYRFAGVTLAIVMLIPRPGPAWVVALHRFLEVSIGIAVALAMTVVWPAPQPPASAKRSEAEVGTSATEVGGLGGCAGA